MYTYYSQDQDKCGYDEEPIYESRKLSRHLIETLLFIKAQAVIKCIFAVYGRRLKTRGRESFADKYLFTWLAMTDIFV